MIEPDAIAICGSMLLAAAAVVVAAMSFRRGRHADADRSGDLSRRAQQARKDLADLMGQLELAGQKLESRVDSRLQELRKLLAEAAAKAAELESLTDSLPPHLSKRPIRAGKGRSDEVLSLCSQGLDAVEIARRTHMDVGEVELLLRLRRSQQSASPPAEVRE